MIRAANDLFRSEIGISAAHQGVIALLANQDGQPISTLARALNLSKPTMTGLIDRMSESGLVKRKIDGEDGRKQKVYLQKKGKELTNAGFPIMRKLNKTLLAPFSTAEQQVIVRFLQSVDQNIEDICLSLKSEPD